MNNNVVSRKIDNIKLKKILDIYSLNMFQLKNVQIMVAIAIIYRFKKLKFKNSCFMFFILFYMSKKLLATSMTRKRAPYPNITSTYRYFIYRILNYTT